MAKVVNFRYGEKQAMPTGVARNGGLGEFRNSSVMIMNSAVEARTELC